MALLPTAVVLRRTGNAVNTALPLDLENDILIIYDRVLVIYALGIYAFLSGG